MGQVALVGLCPTDLLISRLEARCHVAIAGGAIAAAGAIGGAMISSSGAQSAAGTQADAARYSADLLHQQYLQTRSDLLPYNTQGQGAFAQLGQLTGSGPGGNPLTAPLTKPFAPTMDQLAQTPGYQFTLNQGNLAVKNAFGAQGLGGGVAKDPATGLPVAGPSGALGKGLVNYAEGLAGTTFQQQFQNYLSQNAQIYNMLAGQAGLGENAAAMTGNIGASLGQAQAGAIQGAGNALAAGTVGSANALSGGLTGVASQFSNPAFLQQTGLFGPSTRQQAEQQGFIFGQPVTGAMQPG